MININLKSKSSLPSIKPTTKLISPKFITPTKSEAISKVSTIPAFLGGGAYNTVEGKPNELINSGHTNYGGVSQKSGNERADIIPVSLGGVNSKKENISYQKLISENKRDKVVNLTEADKILNNTILPELKAGKISLPEARLKILTFQQQHYDNNGVFHKEAGTDANGKWISSSVKENYIPAIGDTIVKFGKGLVDFFTGFTQYAGETLGAVKASVDPKTNQLRDEALKRLTDASNQALLAAHKETNQEKKKRLLDDAVKTANLAGNDIFLNPEYQRTASQIVGGYLGSAVEALSFGTFGEATKLLEKSAPTLLKSFFKKTGEETVKKVLLNTGKDAVKIGLPLGSTFGLATGLKNNESPLGVAKETALGGALGTATAFGLGLVGRGLSATKGVELGKPKVIGNVKTGLISDITRKTPETVNLKVLGNIKSPESIKSVPKPPQIEAIAKKTEIIPPKTNNVKIEPVFSKAKNVSPEISGLNFSKKREIELANKFSGDYTTKQARLKAIGMRYSALQRKIEGTPTFKEIENTRKYLNSNYKGKKVNILSSNESGEVMGTSYGKIRVKLNDGSIKSFATTEISKSNPSNEYILKELKNKAISELENGVFKDYYKQGKNLTLETPIEGVKKIGNINEQKTSGVTEKIQPEVKPVEQEKLKSKVFERLKSEHPVSLEGNADYSAIKLEEDAKKAVDLIANDRNKAYRVAMNMEDLADQTSTSVNIALVEKAFEEGDYKLASKLIKNRSLAQTRRGQEIVAEKGSISDNSSSKFIKELIKTRLNKLGDKYLAGVSLKNSSITEKSVKIIDREVSKAENVIAKSKNIDLKEAQKLIDKLTCK